MLFRRIVVLYIDPSLKRQDVRQFEFIEPTDLNLQRLPVPIIDNDYDDDNEFSSKYIFGYITFIFPKWHKTFKAKVTNQMNYLRLIGAFEKRSTQLQSLSNRALLDSYLYTEISNFLRSRVEATLGNPIELLNWFFPND